MIVEIQPEKFTEAPAVIVLSDAPENIQAIKEIDAWAWDHGFRRTNEFHLPVLRRKGEKLYRGICYKFTDEYKESAKEAIAETEKRRLSMPLSRDSAEILREMEGD